MAIHRIELRDLNLKSSRLFLRPFTKQDVPNIASAVHSSLPELIPFMPWANPDYSIADSRDFVRRSFTWRRQGRVFGFGIFEAATRELLGSNGLHNVTKDSRSAEIGYWVRSDRAGKGIATESSALILRFAFETLHRHRVVLRAATDNLASNRVAEKLGFHLEGTQRHVDRLPRGWIDLNFYSLLEDEYTRRRDQILSFLAPKND